MASYYRKESILINIPASEIIKKCRFEVGGTGGESDVTGYYTDDKPDKYQLIHDFISVPEVDWYVDSEKIKEYGKEMKRYVYPYKDKFVNKMNSFDRFINIFGSHDVKIPAMFFGGNTGRYLKFDNSDELSKQFKELMYEGVSNLVIERRGKKFFVYPELKRDFFKKLSIQISDIPPVSESKSNLKKEFKNWLSTAKKLDGTPYSINVQSKYLQSVDKACKALSVDIWSIRDYQELVKVLDSFFENDELMKSQEHNYKHNTSSALKCYKRFFEELFGIENAIDDGVVEESIIPERIYPLNMILYGAPGTGKTYSTATYAIGIIEGKTLDEVERDYPDRKALMDQYNDYVNEGRVVFTTFHQSYSYEDFIEGLKPIVGEESLKFDYCNGPFKKIAKTALESDGNFVVIIDEINRGNVSRILGVLITLLEVDKRWGEENQLSIPLPSGELFKVPNNLYVIGTMNTADKSISLIDVALRRRFEFVESPVRLDLITDPTLHSVLSQLNTDLLGRYKNTDTLIGHAYFINKNENDLESIMNNAVIPLLYEYTFDKKEDVLSIVNAALSGTGFEVDKNASEFGRIKIKKGKDE